MAIPFNYPDPSSQLIVTSVTSVFNSVDDPEELVEEVVVVVKDDPPLSLEQWSAANVDRRLFEVKHPSAKNDNLKLICCNRQRIMLNITFRKPTKI